MNTDRKAYFEGARRAVVKVGSGLLTTDDGLNTRAIGAISRQISRLIDSGLEVVLVSSGAMASGVRKLGLARRPEELPKRQAVAAVGQAGLIRAYEKAFGRYGKKVAQILLTGDGLTSRVRYLNARNTLYTLLDWRVVPIINENDTVVVDEIRFGDNDNLSGSWGTISAGGPMKCPTNGSTWCRIARFSTFRGWMPAMGVKTSASPWPSSARSSTASCPWCSRTWFTAWTG